MHQISKKSRVYDLCVSSMLIALVLVATMFINIRLPISVNGGLIHLGNVPLFLAAILFGRKKGAIAGAVGMGMFDMLSGWMLWAPFTFVIRGVMGYIIGTIAKFGRGASFFWNLLAIIVGGMWMILGYYATEVILYGNWITPMTSIPGNVLQIVLAAVVSMPAILVIQKNAYLKKFFQNDDN